MELLHEHSDVKRLAIVGGGHICGSFLEAGLINEVSIMVAKVCQNPDKCFSNRINDQYGLEIREIANADNHTIVEICSLVDITNHYK